MLLRKVLLGVMFFFSISLSAQTSNFPRYEKTDRGAKIIYRSVSTAIDQDIYLDFVNEKIVRVRVLPPGESLPVEKSFILLDSIGEKQVDFSLSEKSDTLYLRTTELVTKLKLSSGTVHFFDARGKPLVHETKRGEQSFQADAYNGDTFYAVEQGFQVDKTEGIFGLGQHQNGVMNYNNGRRVTLLQYNTEIAVPFLVSSNNYGILWHNYAITVAGDTRPLMPLNAFKLISKDGYEGWLTASYVNKDHEEEVYITRPESDIDYNYLTDQHKYPKGVKLSQAKVIYEGELASPYEGLHYVHFKYSGYINVWIDGALLQDRWREAWNPGTFELPVTFVKNKHYKIKIEWIPSGDECYFTINWQRPAEKDKTLFGFQSEAGDAIDYFVVTGENMDDVISGYRQITGKAPIMPIWSFGFWQSRERYKTQQELEDVVTIFRERQIPIDNIVQDWSYWEPQDWGSHSFDSTRFPNPAGMIKRIHDQNVNLMISIWPKINEESSVYKQYRDNDWLYMRNIYDGRKDWIGKGYTSTFYDVYNKDARKAFWDQMNDKLFSLGVDAWWMDASEPDIHSNISVEERKSVIQPNIGSSVRYYNTFPLLNAKGIYEGQRGQDPNKRVFILTRSFFAGQQRYAAAAWSGDIASTWEDMRDQISAGVNFSMSGTPYWTMDAGGFLAEKKFYEPSKADLEEWRELNSRWYQYGAFLPLFRAHGQYPEREPFAIAPEGHPAYESMIYYIKLRYKLLSYNYSLGGMTYFKDYSMIRGLVMDFPNDQLVYNINDQYMWGPSLLVNPVTTNGVTSRSIYLPGETVWYDLYNGKSYEGGRRIDAPAPYERIPVFVKGGSILPIGDDLQYTTERNQKNLTLMVYDGADANFTLYEDAGINYDYEKGNYMTIDLQYDAKSGQLTIGEHEGAFPGMLTNRVFNIVLIDGKHAAGLDKIFNRKKTVKYSGKALTVKLK